MIEALFVVEGSQAYNAGVRKGDKILAFNDVVVKSLIDYIRAKRNSGEYETILVSRYGEQKYFRWKKNRG